MTCKDKVYVVVVHNASGRAFTLNRGYGLIAALAQDCKAIVLHAGQRVASTWDGWTPSGGWQRPAWIESIPAAEFRAYWLTE